MKKHYSLTAFFLAVLLLAGCAVPANKELLRGAIEGNVYTSKFAGVSFTAPEGWVFSTEDELKEMLASQLSKYGEQASDDLLENRIIYDMVVKKPSNGSFVAVSYQNLELLAGQYNTDANLFTEDDMLDSVKTVLAESPQYGSVTGDITDMKLGSTNFRSLSTVLTDGSAMYYFARKIDKLMLQIIINTMPGDDIEDIVKCFS